MSGLFRTVPPRSFPVALGDTLTLYATAWKLSAERQYAQQSSVSGNNYVTNSSNRAKQLVLEGKFCYLENPSDVILPLDTAIQERTLFSFSLRDIQVNHTSILEYTVSENAEEGYLSCRLVMLIIGTLSVVETDDTATEDTTDTEAVT